MNPKQKEIICSLRKHKITENVNKNNGIHSTFLKSLNLELPVKNKTQKFF